MGVGFFARARQDARRFAGDSAGSVLPVMAVLLVILVVVAGAAIDYSRAVNERAKIANALDVTALTVAAKLSTSVMTDDELDAAFQDAFDANLPDSDYKASAITNLEYQLDPDEGTIRIWSRVEVPTKFIHAGGLGPNTLDVGIESEVNYSKFDVELALVLDVTGSMRQEIGDLRDAAEEIVDTLIPDGTTDGKVRISVVPYSVGVNVGSYATIATNGLSSRCATERDGVEQYTDASYTVEPIGDGSGMYRSQDCSDSEILPLSDDRGDLLTNIRNLTTDGYTAGQTGIGWGWYTLSPNWADLWPADSDPAAYTDDDVLKFALIMTDGDFNTYYDLETWKENKCEQRRKQGKYKGTCKSGTNDYWVEKSSGGFSGQSSKRARDLCDAMKDEDIRIYTVYFGGDGSSAGAQVMRRCASDEGTTYFQASNGASLISAFGKIAKEIQSIYISK